MTRGQKLKINAAMDGEGGLTAARQTDLSHQSLKEYTSTSEILGIILDFFFVILRGPPAPTEAPVWTAFSPAHLQCVTLEQQEVLTLQAESSADVLLEHLCF